MPRIPHLRPVAERDLWDENLDAIGQRIRARKLENANRRSLDIQSWRELADMGFWRVLSSRTPRGQGATWRAFGSDLRKLARCSGDIGFLLSAIAHAGLIRAISTWGSDEQKERYLNRLYDGSVGATAITETQAGSDIHGIMTCVRRTVHGFRVDGEKAHITNAPCADLILLVCRASDGEPNEMSLWVVETSAKGVTIGPSEAMMGNHTSPTGSIKFNDVHLTSHELLSRPGGALRILYRTIAVDRAMYAIVCAGIMENMLEQALNYSLERMAFGRPIAENQYVQKRLTDIKIAVGVSLALGYSALEKIDANDPEAVLSASAAKLVATESLVAAAEHLMVIHGHKGYMAGPISELVSDAFGTRIAGGTSDIQRVAIYEQMIRLRRQV